ncbi:transcription-repair coupling factor [Rickettsiales endosymbiont of Trichoplax sp. H2]|uniref:transcription-repair coupling factor n=1 Tax=Rickettsiales endosymbiont of Trichoplax sp. H2 TaxID=2021221 RepID=UPI0012B31D80|nr:transcription-repair coupling factor [Rickettsiales endosymbiont of Trichoplax sp. H2]MSO13751.1 Transcription-repair-coupling factor [Rickettsiales endosymbiont of Trichoplax sp. H2]
MLNTKYKIIEKNLYSPKCTKAYVINQLLQKEDSILYIANNEKKALETYDNSKFFIPQDILVIYLPGLNSTPYDIDSCTNYGNRASLLHQLATNIKSKKLIISSIAGLIQYQTPINLIKNNSKNLQVNNKYNFTELIKFLTNIGYTRVDIVEEFGEFSVRGSIIDIMIFGSDFGIRLNFIDNILENIKKFDINTQISHYKIQSINIPPAHEIFIDEESKNFQLLKSLKNLGEKKLKEKTLHLKSIYYQNPNSIFDYLNNIKVIVRESDFEVNLDEYWKSINKKYKNNNNEYDDAYNDLISPSKIYLPPVNISKKISSLSNFILTKFHNYNEDEFKQIDNLYYTAKLNKISELDNLKNFLSQANSNFNSKKVIIFFTSKAKQERIKKYFTQNDYKIDIISNIDEAIKSNNKFFISKLALETGFISKNFIFISEKDIFGKSLTISNSRKKNIKKFTQNSHRLYSGELVVHKKFGIGKYEGIQEIKTSNTLKDFIKITYLNNDKLFIPIENFDLITKYGGDSENSNLDQLGKSSWSTRRTKAKNKIAKIAKKLIAIAAERKIKKGIELHPIYSSYEKFCNSFEYIETNDQLSAIEDIIQDLGSGGVTDRLICGDVGFGKTEIAMRAAFITVKGDTPSQVAILAPTTLLVEQHNRTFCTRFAGFDINIKFISSKNTKSQKEKIKKELKNGEIDIIIGTHALLADNIYFKNLGLVIVDEEQNFGVAQKEKLKQLKKNVHMLTLSATPIPRTLQMSLVGIRDLSIISTPPLNRKPIKTYILPFSLEILKQAIHRESSRGGIVLIVTPRIKYISDIEKLIKKHFSNLRYSVIHGQVDNQSIDDTSLDLRKNNIDILISTQIIESGLDIANANTIIIDKSNMFGLSQLYQIRGRVGRRAQQAYAYLTYDSKAKFKNEIQERLSIIQSLDQLGSSFSLATADMDMRGYGNLIGEEQSGNIRDIGVELYQHMLFEAIKSLEQGNQNIEEEDDINPKIITQDSIFIPKTYITNENLRCITYRKIASLDNIEEFDKLSDELNDRFGMIPKEVNNLIDIAKIKFAAKKCNVEKIDINNKQATIKFSKINIGNSVALKYFELLNTLLKDKAKCVIYNN